MLPGLAVAKALQEKCAQAKVHFFVTSREIDKKVLHGTGYSMTAQLAQPFSLRPMGLARFAWGFWRSQREARAMLAILRPAAVLGMGGFAAGPLGRLAGKMKIPLGLLNPDAEPGRANRWLATRAGRIFVQWPRTAELLRDRCAGQVQVTGCPVRREIFSATRQQGVERFDLRADRKTLLVPGGSQGAMNVNLTVVELLGRLDELGERWQILHLTGPGKLQVVRAGYERAGVRMHYKLVDFTQDMPEALAAADLVLSRAGASSLAEFTARRLPAVLMPYPYGRDQHQTANARCLADEAAAVIVPDKCNAAANAEAVGPVLLDLMGSDQELSRMSAAYETLYKPDAAEMIAEELLNMAR